MKIKYLLKDTKRTIGKTKGRFFSILLIVALGSGFFGGVQMAAPTMEKSAEDYFDHSNLADASYISTLGFEEEEYKKAQDLPFVKEVELGYRMDFLAEIGTDTKVMRVMSYDSSQKMNLPRLVEGRFPEIEGECIVLASEMSEVKIGERIKLSLKEEEADAYLANTEYTVVGIYDSPLFIGKDLGTTHLGTGRLEGAMSILSKDFTLDLPTNLYVKTVEKEKDTFNTEAYQSQIKEDSQKIEETLKQTVETRALRIYEEGVEKLSLEESKLRAEEEKVLNQLKEGEKKLELGKKQLNEGKEKLEKTKEQILNGAEKKKEELEQGIKEVNKAVQEGIKHKELQSQLSNILEQTSLKEEDKAILQQGNILAPQLGDKILAYIETGEQQEKEEIQGILTTVKSKLQEKENKLSLQQRGMKKGLEEIEKQKNTFLQTYDASKEELNKGSIAIEEGRKKLEKGKEEATAGFSAGKEELGKGKEELEKIKSVGIFPQTRQDNVGYGDYFDNAGRIAVIGNIFPFFFVLVALLVIITTVTRMVDEERTGIGVLKALGYQGKEIGTKFYLYPVMATMVGCILGIVVGVQVFPRIIFFAYQDMYRIPEFTLTLSWKVIIPCIVLYLGGTVIAVWLSIRLSMNQTSSQLMRPVPPKNGQRVLVERIPFLWNKLNFTQKLSVRNLFRYKKRLCMTVIGIAGCTALMLAGFGIKDSFSTVVKEQYGKLFHYDSMAILEDDLNPEKREKMENIFKENNKIEGYQPAYQKTHAVKGKEEEKPVQIMVVPQKEELDNFMEFYHPKGEKVSLTNEGVLITEKMAKTLNVSKGDTVEIEFLEGVYQEVIIEEVVQNYTYHYLYMSQEYYEKILGVKGVPNSYLLTLAPLTPEEENIFAEQLNSNAEVLGVSMVSHIKNNILQTVNTLNLIVVVLIVCAGLLAFIVLYNLNNVNVNERIRELATIKVLGFYPKEVTGYIFKESLMATILAIIVGSFLGIGLHKFIIQTVEIDILMFGRNIFPMSFIYAGMLTLVFMGIVNIFLHFKLKGINMVEALKSVE